MQFFLMKVGDLGVTRLYTNRFHQEIRHKEFSKSFVRCLLLNADKTSYSIHRKQIQKWITNDWSQVN